MKKFYVYYVKISELRSGVLKEYISHIAAKDIDAAIKRFYKWYSKDEYEVSGYDEIMTDGSKMVLDLQGATV